MVFGWVRETLLKMPTDETLKELIRIAPSFRDLPTDETMRLLLAAAPTLEQVPRDSTLRDLIRLFRETDGLKAVKLPSDEVLQELLKLTPYLRYLEKLPEKETLERLLALAPVLDKLPDPETLKKLLEKLDLLLPFVQALQDDVKT